MNNRETMESIFNGLVEIKKGFNVNKNISICQNLYDKTSDRCKVEIWLFAMIVIWPECYVHKSGIKDVYFPINGYEGFVLEQNNKTLWENPRRLQFLDFLIEKAAIQLKEMDGQQS